MLFRFKAAPLPCLLAAVLVAGCGGDSTQPPGPPAALLPVGATSLARVAGSTAVDSLAVKVVDADGRAVSNAQVYWTPGPEVLTTVSPESGVTNRDGIARAAVRVGTIAGVTSVRASIPGLGGPSASFPVAVNAGPMARLLVTATATLSPGTLRTLVLGGDQYGNATPLTGVTLTSSNPAVAEVNAAGEVTARAFGATVISAVAEGLQSQSQVRVVPATIQVCETNTWVVCADWRLGYSAYSATWSPGAYGVIEVGYFGADSVRFHRVDSPGSTSAGMTAVYTGPIVGAGVQNGRVTWTQNGSSFSGSWMANW